MDILIIDNNVELCQVIAEYLNQQPGMCVVGQAYDGADGLQQMKDHQPDMVILDLAMPKIDGLGVLEHLQTQDQGKRPKIIVLTAFGRDEIMAKMLDLGVDRFLVKPFSVETLLLRIQELDGQASPAVPQGAPRRQRETLEADVTSLLMNMGVPSHFKGFSYLREAVVLCAAKGYLAGSLTKELYPTVARTFQTTPSGVEAAIRHAVSYAWDHGDRDYMKGICGAYQEQRVPTNSLVIACLVESLRAPGQLPQ